ncbi:unnamed protein product [Rotaria sp. Silwood1]|nr:unnamed protein product [Rotaria sp. Silwood1]CAF1471428.1 unnamed protein product [Rotaria sp. Silwood1]CAF3630123.1 unnamed protein product [Rotaria sp. Silwood1]CAF3660236.1 unnamed protein product [Rotaria sp. Silwood1]CAF3673086.1 unnamed protein product [Rotaria sp. Silwood1]
MKQYAINDCAAVVDLFFHMYREKVDDHYILETPTTTSTNIIMNLEHELSDNSKDELIQYLKPKFDKRETTLYPSDDEKNILATQPTEEEMCEFNMNEAQQV